MVCCEQILKDLALHEDSWPFLQPVNLREVGFFMLLVSYYSSLRSALFRNIAISIGIEQQTKNYPLLFYAKLHLNIVKLVIVVAKGANVIILQT